MVMLSTSAVLKGRLNPVISIVVPPSVGPPLGVN